MQTVVVNKGKASRLVSHSLRMKKQRNYERMRRRGEEIVARTRRITQTMLLLEVEDAYIAVCFAKTLRMT